MLSHCACFPRHWITKSVKSRVGACGATPVTLKTNPGTSVFNETPLKTIVHEGVASPTTNVTSRVYEYGGAYVRQQASCLKPDSGESARTTHSLKSYSLPMFVRVDLLLTSAVLFPVSGCRPRGALLPTLQKITLAFPRSEVTYHSSRQLKRCRSVS